jgi:plastocyanin
MHPAGVANAASVIAAAPSKVPFYVAGGLLAGWAVLLGLIGLSHADFPASEGRARLVMLTTGVLVAATVTAAVLTAGEESEGAASESGAAGAGSVQLAADPSGKLAYDRRQISGGPGKFTLRLINRSSTPHNVTIARGAKVLTATKTIEGTTTSTTVTLPPGDYTFFCSVDAHRQAGMQGTLTVK